MRVRNAHYSETIVQALNLETPPVAMAFVDEPPADIQANDTQVTSACSFWRKAESALFYAPAESHFNCPVGAMTLGFDLPESAQTELMGAVEIRPQLSPDMLFRAPTVEQLAKLLSRPGEEGPRRTLVPIQTAGCRRPRPRALREHLHTSEYGGFCVRRRVGGRLS